MKKKSPGYWLVFVAILAAALFYRFYGTSSAVFVKDDGGFSVRYLDVGQGDSELLQCDGHYMLIDGGTSEYSDTVYAYLKKLNVTQLDYIVCTHPHADHAGGLSGALQYASVKTALSPVKSYDNDEFKDFKKYLKQQNVSITIPSPGNSFMLGSAKVTVLGPISASDDPNDMSIVLRVVYGDTSFLFVGDAQEAEENDLLESGRTLQSTVLKVGHHGSETSTAGAFLANQGTLDRLKAFGVKLYRTNLQGTILCQSDGKTVTFTPEKNADANPFVKKEQES